MNYYFNLVKEYSLEENKESRENNKVFFSFSKKNLKEAEIHIFVPTPRRIDD